MPFADNPPQEENEDNHFLKQIEDAYKDLEKSAKAIIDNFAKKSSHPENFSKFNDEVESYIKLSLVQLRNNHSSYLEEKEKKIAAKQTIGKEMILAYVTEAKNYVLSARDEALKIFKAAEAELATENFSKN